VGRVADAARLLAMIADSLSAFGGSLVVLGEETFSVLAWRSCTSIIGEGSRRGGSGCLCKTGGSRGRIWGKISVFLHGMGRTSWPKTA
jgi:hypothetical protein